MPSLQREHIEIANSAQEAFRKMPSAPFDMVISDMHMPGLDGLALMRQIRRHYPEVKLILMTGDNTVEVADSANEIGVDCCIEKPYIPRQFAETVRDLLADGAGGKNDSENVEKGVT